MLQLWTELPGLERLAAGVALTFDDGPDPETTPAVLEELDAAGARATFFVVGEQVEAHPALAREIAERGHQLEAHCFDHQPHQELADPVGDLARTLEVIGAATGVTPAMQRPPYGRFSAASHAACIDAGLRPIYWSAWGEDWEDIGADRIADLVNRDLSPGAVILLHDSARYAYRRSARATAGAIPIVAAALADLGLEATTISAALG